MTDNVQESTGTAPSQGQATTVNTPTPATDEGGNANGSVAGAGQEQAGGETRPVEDKGFEIPEKFKGKSIEDVAKAYVELESHNKKVEMEKADLEKLFVPEPEQTQNNQTAADQEPSDDPLAPVRPVIRDEFTKMLSPVVAKLEVESMYRKYGDSFVAVAKDVASLRKEKPFLSMDDAYKIVAHDSLERTSKNQGAEQANAKNIAAQKAQVESTQPSGKRDVTLAEAVKNKDIPTRELFEALGPEYRSWVEHLPKK